MDSRSPPTTSSAALSDLLERHGRESPGRNAFTFLGEHGEPVDRLTYGDLLVRATAVAAELAARDLAGGRALLVHPPGADFIVAFCGCLLAGVVAVPLPPLANRRQLDRASAIAADCRAAAVLVTAAGASRLDGRFAAVGMQVIATDAVGDGTGPSRGVRPAVADIAFLQYTSGSTGDPKGVMVTHGNLAANCMQIRQAFAFAPEDVVVSWLPLHHDMGLIGSVVAVIHHGLHCVHLMPQAMIRRPLRWLQAVHRYRAAVSGAPDFAWRLLAERLAPADLTGLDLSCWRVAYSGAEPVRADTLDRAAVLLAGTGFRADAFLPCYGLAEATLLVSGGPRGSELRLEAPAEAEAGDEPTRCYLGCGMPVPDRSVAIVDPDACRAVPERRIGEVWVRGAHVAAGYWGREELSGHVFRARLHGGDGAWLRTGDLGFLAAGQLFISGRIKDLLIVHGRKHHAEDLESTVRLHLPACARGAQAAFQVDDGRGTRLVMAVEVAVPVDGAERARLLERINAAIWCFHEILLDEVVTVRVGRLPRTTSGKIRRGEVRVLHLAGRLAGGAAEEPGDA